MLIPSLKDIPTLTTVPDGEYTMRIVKAKDVESKKEGNRKGMQFQCKIIGVENALDVYHSIWMDLPGYDDADKAAQMLRGVKRFITSIGLDPDQEISNEDFEGIEFSALLKTTYFNGEPKNEIHRIV